MNTFKFPEIARKNLIIAMIVGLVILALGTFLKAKSISKEAHPVAHHEGNKHESTEHAVVEHSNNEHHEESSVNEEHPYGFADPFGHTHPASITKVVVGNIYAVFLLCFWVAIAALFFLSGSTLALGGWQIQIQKIPLAIATTLIVTVPAMVIIFALFGHDLFHWMDPELYKKGSPHFDEILNSKHDYLNPTRFWIFAVILFGLSFILLKSWWNNLSQQEVAPSVKLFDKSRALAAASIVIIAMVINTFGSWDWGMSVQPHWFSTMFSWYTMASGAVTMFSITMLAIIYLKSKGYLPRVNDNHRHDIGKFMFAITVFWTYVWFSQFMLIWYTNFPEETLYFNKRIHGYKFMWYLTIGLNFILPFLILLTRNAKRSINVVIVAASIIIVGHWFDFFSMIVPELVPQGGFGLISIGAFITVGSIFTLTFLTALSKVKDLESSTHPFISESYQHHI